MGERNSRFSKSVLKHSVTMNDAQHKIYNGHEPYFSLTPAGAKKLMTHLVKNGFDLHSGSGIKPNLLKKYFEEAGISSELTGPVMATLLGSVSTGAVAGYVQIDSLVLRSLANGKLRVR